MYTRLVLGTLLLIPTLLLQVSCTEEPPPQDRNYYDELPLDELDPAQTNMLYTVRTEDPANHLLGIT